MLELLERVAMDTGITSEKDPGIKIARLEVLLTEQIKLLNSLRDELRGSLSELRYDLVRFQERFDLKLDMMSRRVDGVTSWQDRCDGFRGGQEWRRQDIYILSCLGLLFIAFLGYVFRSHL